ncbi:MAG: alpha/beta hydrolase, partial [Actinomycetota bacterium]
LILVDPALPRALKASADPVVAAVFATYIVPGVGERFMRQRAKALGVEGVVRETMKLCCVDAERIDPAVLAYQIEISKERGDMEWANKAFLEAARSLLRRLARRERFLTTLKQISCPTLLLQGDKDRLVPLAAAKAVAAARPDWRMHVFEDTGHVPQLERAAEWLAVVGEWLNDGGRAAVAISSADRLRAARDAAEASG